MPQQRMIMLQPRRVTVFFSIFAGGGVDYNTPNPTTFTFTSGQTTQCTNIPINDDTLCEGDDDETFTIVLSSPSASGASLSPASATVSVNDNDCKSQICGTHKKCTHSISLSSYVLLNGMTPPIHIPVSLLL